jgi:uncharacterized protein (TIGR03790 family)
MNLLSVLFQSAPVFWRLLQRRGIILGLLNCLSLSADDRAEPRDSEPEIHEGQSVAVVYNRNVPESRALAEYYAGQRQVPENQLFGFDLPNSENISRSEFRTRLQMPLLKTLEQQKLITFTNAPAGKAQSDSRLSPVIDARIRYLALCYGVPLRIQNDPRLVEEEMDKLRPELRRNEAAVDSELAALPLVPAGRPLYGAVANPGYGATNNASLHPANGLLMVARLDGPTPEIARGLIDKALEAEKTGLWGRAYFDARGLTNSNHQLGDNWILSAAELSRRRGYEVVIDNQPGTFPAGFPISHLALYAGWYDTHVSGPFARGEVEFMPGAFAYHIHSFSAATIRAPDRHWVGPLLHHGATATMGYVFEPYLEGTSDLGVFFSRFIFAGFSFGEAAYASLNSLSWQTTVVGDPLYRPFARHPQQIHAALQEENNPLIEWSHLAVVNINLATGLPAPELIGYLQKIPETGQSAALQEKLGALHFLNTRFAPASEAYQKALELAVSKPQRQRLFFSLGQALEFSDKSNEAFQVYQKFLEEFPGHPRAVLAYERLVPLAKLLGKDDEAQLYQKELNRLRASE